MTTPCLRHGSPSNEPQYLPWSSAVSASSISPFYRATVSRPTCCLATERCDAIVVTGDATGMETNPTKIASFREILGPDFPLITGAGVTVANCVEQLAETDGMIIGSYLKDTFAAEGEVSADHVEALMTVVRRIRAAAEPDTPDTGG